MSVKFMDATKGTPELGVSRSICGCTLAKGRLCVQKRDARRHLEKREIYLRIYESIMVKNHSSATLLTVREASPLLTFFRIIKRSINLRDHIYVATATRSF